MLCSRRPPHPGGVVEAYTEQYPLGQLASELTAAANLSAEASRQSLQAIATHAEVVEHRAARQFHPVAP